VGPYSNFSQGCCRYPYKGYGVMVYWHVETNAVCIYAQTKTFSNSEVAAMIEGLVRHDTEMRVEKNFVDSHGQPEVAFVFCTCSASCG
jgi:TnpA family transposase